MAVSGSFGADAAAVARRDYGHDKARAGDPGGREMDRSQMMRQP